MIYVMLRCCYYFAQKMRCRYAERQALPAVAYAAMFDMSAIALFCRDAAFFAIRPPMPPLRSVAAATPPPADMLFADALLINDIH